MAHRRSLFTEPGIIPDDEIAALHDANDDVLAEFVFSRDLALTRRQMGSVVVKKKSLQFNK